MRQHYTTAQGSERRQSAATTATGASAERPGHDWMNDPGLLAAHGFITETMPSGTGHGPSPMGGTPVQLQSAGPGSTPDGTSLTPQAPSALGGGSVAPSLDTYLPLGGSVASAVVQKQEGTPGNAATGATPATSQVDEPVPDDNRPGFIDNDDGSNIRTRPAELAGSKTLTATPLPPTTRVFVSGRHPQTAQWWYVTAFRPEAIIRGYVQGFRVTTDLPEPTAKLYQIKSGDTAEKLAVQEFSSAVRDGHDLRYYENVLLAVNRDNKRAGVKGTFQDPGILGGGANNVQLEAGRRIWLVSPAYARSLEGKVPDGSLSNGLYAKAKRVLGHLEDIVQSVTDSPVYFGDVAGEYAAVIKDHLPEIIGITAGFILAESTSAFLAATPTGVGQLAAVVIQLGLAAFGATFAVDAGVQALQHGEQWLTLAWTAHGDPAQLAAASKEFLKMQVSIAMAALAIAGVRGNAGQGLKIADSITIKPPTLGWSPAMATPGGGIVAGGPVFTPGSITSAGPVPIKPSMMSATGAGGSRVKPKESSSNTKPGENGLEQGRGQSKSKEPKLIDEPIYGVDAKYRWVTDQHGHEVKRYLVKSEDELLRVAENAAGGSLDNLVEIKPNWYEGEIGGQRIKIEWQPGGERVMNEGPHVKIQRWDAKKGKGGKWLAPEKIFIEGKEMLHGNH